MKILLAAVNAKYIHSNLAVYSLKAYAEDPAVEIGEYTINQQKDDILMISIRDNRIFSAFPAISGIWTI